MCNSFFLKISHLEHQQEFTKKSFTHGWCRMCSSRTSPCAETTVKVKVKVKQAWSGLDGSRKLRFPDFMTTARDGGKVVRLTHRPPLPPGNIPGTHFC
jgi:hypothetical protein